MTNYKIVLVGPSEFRVEAVLPFKSDMAAPFYRVMVREGNKRMPYAIYYRHQGRMLPKTAVAYAEVAEAMNAHLTGAVFFAPQ